MAYKQSQGSTEEHFLLRELYSHVKPLDAIAFFDRPASECKKQFADSKIALPTFNTDRLYFTPTFILPCDQNYYKLNESFERYIFKEKIQRNLQFLKPSKVQWSEENIRFSSPTNDFCQICQQKYQNYFEHTSSREHQLLAKNSEFNSSIQQLCRNFQDKNKKKITKLNKQMKAKRNTHSYCKPQLRSSKMAISESSKSQISSTRVVSE